MIYDITYINRARNTFILAMCIIVITFVMAILFSPSMETFKSIIGKMPTNSDKIIGLKKVWMYIVNNAFHVPFQMLLLSLIPIPFLYFLNLITTSIITGVVFGFAINVIPDKGLLLVISSVPHMIIEILAISFVASGLYPLNKAIVRIVSNLFRKEKKENLSVKPAFLNLIKIYVIIALPLFIIAAFAETYLTEFILNIFS